MQPGDQFLDVASLLLGSAALGKSPWAVTVSGGYYILYYYAHQTACGLAHPPRFRIILQLNQELINENSAPDCHPTQGLTAMCGMAT